MMLRPAIRFFLLLSTSAPGLLAYGHGSHPKCTTMPASEVYHGTCYFQYEDGIGYVRKTCPSGTLYSQQECGCVEVTQSGAPGMTTNSLEVETTDDNDGTDDAREYLLEDRSTFLRNFFSGGPLSILKFLFADNDDRNNDDFFARDDEGRNNGKHDGFDDYDNFLFYGDESDGQELESRDFWDEDHDFDFSPTLNSRGESAFGTTSDDNNNDARENDDAVVTDDLGEQPSQESSEYSSSAGGADDVYNINSHNRKSNLLDMLAAKGFTTFDNNADASDIINLNTDDGENDVDDKNEDEKENDEDDFGGYSRHGYRSIYSIKGLLNQQKQYRYENLFVDLLNDDDHDNEDKRESDNELIENYQNIYEEKLDGVLEYVDDLFNDIFNDDFDNFYEDLFDGDGYDDCFVKKYVHYFDEDFENELDDRYGSFDYFFKNHNKIKSLATRLINYNTDDDEDKDANGGIGNGNDREFRDNENNRNTVLDVGGNGNAPFFALGDVSDDSDENGWPGSVNLKSFAASLENRKQSKPRDSRLFDFSRMLRPNQNQPRNIFDVFYQGPSKH